MHGGASVIRGLVGKSGDGKEKTFGNRGKLYQFETEELWGGGEGGRIGLRSGLGDRLSTWPY